jgi:succinate-semialdehyde dehydrogenase / glutarate-semialdehyde dehydrogenase
MKASEVGGGSSGVRLGGQAAEPISPWPVTSIEPTTGQPLGSVVGGGAADAAVAVDVAAQAFEAWRDSPVQARATALRGIADSLRSDPARSELATLISRETGKRISESFAEIGLTAAFSDWFAAAIQGRGAATWDVVPGTQHHVYSRPLGVVAAITPWNFPVSIPGRKISAAIAAGCTVVFRPSEMAPLAALRLAEIIDEHVPAGLVNTVIGPPRELAETWLADQRVRGLTFTGSTSVGQRLAEMAARNLTRCVLELGGKAPFVVLDDADVDHAVSFLAAAKYRNNGQSCIAADQLWVPRSLADDVLEGFTRATEALVLGDPLDEATTLGPLAKPYDPERLESMLAEAADASSTVVRPKMHVPATGQFGSPAICVGPPAGSRIASEEIFGPLLAVQIYDELADVVAAVRASRHGLGGYVAGRDIGRAAAVARSLDVGIVGVNTATPNTPQVPFAGLGLSGLGTEGSNLGLEAFLTSQTVAVAGA